MKKIIVSLFCLLSLGVFADQIIVSGNIKFNLRDDNTYVIVRDGEIVTTSSGRKILLKDDHTWEPLVETQRNTVITDKNGRRVWIKSDGRWGYMNRTGYLRDDFKFREISLDGEGRNTRIIGKVRNVSGEDYANTSFSVVVFDSADYEYKTLGEFQVADFRNGDDVRFEGVLRVRRENIQDYYIELREAVKRPVEQIEKIKPEKTNKRKTIGEAHIDLNFGN